MKHPAPFLDQFLGKPGMADPYGKQAMDPWPQKPVAQPWPQPAPMPSPAEQEAIRRKKERKTEAAAQQAQPGMLDRARDMMGMGAGARWVRRRGAASSAGCSGAAATGAAC